VRVDALGRTPNMGRVFSQGLATAAFLITVCQIWDMRGSSALPKVEMMSEQDLLLYFTPCLMWDVRSVARVPKVESKSEQGVLPCITSCLTWGVQGRATLPKVEMEMGEPVVGRAPSAGGGSHDGTRTAATEAAEAECIKELFSRLSTKCPFCGAASPKYKK
jgi:hypothetical protein